MKTHATVPRFLHSTRTDIACVAPCAHVTQHRALSRAALAAPGIFRVERKGRRGQADERDTRYLIGPDERPSALSLSLLFSCLVAAAAQAASREPSTHYSTLEDPYSIHGIAVWTKNFVRVGLLYSSSKNRLLCKISTRAFSVWPVISRGCRGIFREVSTD